jgi:hypothetical protein
MPDPTLPGPKGPVEPIGPKPIVPKPIGPVGPIRPPFAPAAPFTPGDQSTPDVAAILQAAKDIKAKLENDREKLLGRSGHSDNPDNPDNPDEPHGSPIRSKSFVPFLLVRAYPGDCGARPVTQAAMGGWNSGSPDIIVVPASLSPIGTIFGREEARDFMAQQPSDYAPMRNQPIDVWVHVWNLGQAAAYGVRIRARESHLWDGPSPEWEEFIGGAQLDLGDRTSPRSHALIKVATWTMPPEAPPLLTIRVVAECLTDTASTTFDAVADRHCAWRAIDSTA